MDPRGRVRSLRMTKVLKFIITNNIHQNNNVIPSECERAWESTCVVCGFRYGCSRFAQHDTELLTGYVPSIRS